tara:strand:- start:109 stop:450 length:342 start_codon:yes stop_codon:yes gene_type:complete
MKVNLTDRKIKSLKAQDKKYKTWDIAVSGLYLMTMPSGYKVFKLAYRIGKYQKESTLGQYPILSLQVAPCKLLYFVWTAIFEHPLKITTNNMGSNLFISVYNITNDRFKYQLL